MMRTLVVTNSDRLQAPGLQFYGVFKIVVVIQQARRLLCGIVIANTFNAGNACQSGDISLCGSRNATGENGYLIQCGLAAFESNLPQGTHNCVSLVWLAFIAFVEQNHDVHSGLRGW
jgi:hypothetical protein